MINKIEKQIKSLREKINGLSGNYQTNTWKRMNEQKSRDAKIDSYKFDIDILEHLKQIAEQRELTTLENAMITKSVRDTLHQYYSWNKASKNPNAYVREIQYPEIKDDTPEWQHKEIQQKIKRLQKVGINNFDELLSAISEYETLIDTAVKPVDNTQRLIKELTNKARLQQKGDINFTPSEVAERLVDLARVNGESKVLEPSAGIGNIADKIKEVTDRVDVVEQMSSFRELLKLKGHNLVGYNFFEFETDNTYDAVIMNPPFSNNQDIEHVRHAYNFVNDGGVLVSIMSLHWAFANDKKSVEFREWLEEQDYFTEHLNGGTFEATGVNSKIVVIHKGV